MNRFYSKKLVVFVLLASIAMWTVPLSAVAQKTAGIDIAGMDRSVAPGDDFFSYANGGWMKSTEIPADSSSFGAFDVIFEEVSKRTAGLITAAAKSSDPEAKMVGDYYAAYLNDAAIEKRGLDPIKAQLSEIDGIKDKTQLSRYLGEQLRADVDPLNATDYYTDNLFGLFISADFNNPTMNVPYMLQGGLGMPDRDNYISTDERNTGLQAKYRAHITSILELAKMPGAAESTARIYGLENKIAGFHSTREESSDVHKANNPWKLSDFSTNAARYRLECVLQSGKPRGYADDHGLASGRDQRTLIAGRERTARCMERIFEVQAYRPLGRPSARRICG